MYRRELPDGQAFKNAIERATRAEVIVGLEQLDYPHEQRRQSRRHTSAPLFDLQVSHRGNRLRITAILIAPSGAL
jgi:hypothetical protein